MKRFISIFFAHKVLFARKIFSLIFLFERNTAFVLQGYPSGRLPRVARNDRVLRTEYNKCLFAGNYLQNFRTFFILSRATHFMSLRGIANGDAVAIARKGHLVNPTQDTFVLAWRKRNKQAKDKQLSLATIVWSKVQFIPGVTNTIFAVLSTSFLNRTAKSYDILSNPP